MSRHDQVNMTVAFRHATRNGVCITEDGERDVWLPRMLVAFDGDLGLLTKDELIEISIPEWLAFSRGLI